MNILESFLAGGLLPLAPIAAGHAVLRAVAHLEPRQAIPSAGAVYLGRMVLALAVVAFGVVALRASPAPFVLTFVTVYLGLSLAEAFFFSPLRPVSRSP